jgi:Holliday junction resolvase-like predicted endonuclease
MSEISSAVPMAAIERATRAIEVAKLPVIDRDWQSEEHRLDPVATPGEGILAAVEVRAVAHGTIGACVTAITEDRIRQLTGAGRAWVREHDAHFDDLWRVNAEIPRDELPRRFMPGGGWEPIERATSLGMVSDFAAADALRVAWTLADLNGRARPTCGDCAAALGLRIGEMR